MPRYSYYHRAKAAFDDKEATLAHGGYIEQSFVARQAVIGSVAVIAGRSHAPDQLFSDDNIGMIRLQLFQVTVDGHGQQELPLQLLHEPAPQHIGGVVVHPRNHLDAIFSLAPATAIIGQHYSVRITNDTTNALIAISVRRQPVADGPTFIKAPNGAVRRYGYGLSAYVCDRSEDC